MDQGLAGKVMVILSRHIGEEKAVSMGELYERVYGKAWKNKINDTRPLRKVITELRYSGALIGETRSSAGGGYFLARSVHELNRFFDKRKREALRKLLMVARMQRVGLPELLGQMQLSLRGKAAGGGNERA
ncbi:MAG: hypothetical protein JRJ66_02215 [Deltaproteobacteria bacterium]|nr:hypothetical protein [Deltaproteobacteria bacterium]